MRSTPRERLIRERVPLVGVGERTKSIVDNNLLAKVHQPLRLLVLNHRFSVPIKYQQACASIVPLLLIYFCSLTTVERVFSEVMTSFIHVCWECYVMTREMESRFSIRTQNSPFLLCCLAVRRKAIRQSSPNVKSSLSRQLIREWINHG